MSVDLPAWGAGELMVKAKKKLFKMGWKQMSIGRIDCIEKVFGDVMIKTIWAGNQLLLIPHKAGIIDDLKGYVPLDAPEVAQAGSELESVFVNIVRRNKKVWDLEIKEYEKMHNIVYTRNAKYGV